MLLILLLTLIILFIITLFSNSKFSPVPYYPTNKKDIPLIIKGLRLKNNQTIIDFGAGDGIVIFEAARTSFQKKLNTQFVAVEINPILVFILYLHRLFHPNRKNIKIIWGDFFKFNFMDFIDFKDFITIYIYISPWLINKVIQYAEKQFKQFSIVSYFYGIKNREPKRIFSGKHQIFIY